jgi:hypothetical protein
MIEVAAMLGATMNNTNAAETVKDVLERLDAQIRQFESDLARGMINNKTRSDLSGMLRQAKALRAALHIAVEGGSLATNSLLFDNHGMPTADRGTFLYEILRKAEEGTSLFSWNRGQMGENGNHGYYGPEGQAAMGYGPDPVGYGPNSGFIAPPPLFTTNAASGPPGTQYPGLSGYVFGKDSATAVQKAAGRPMPNQWPATGTSNYFVYGDNLLPYQVVRGYLVPGTVKTYYDTNALDSDGSMTYLDGTYQTSLAIPPTATTVTPAQSSGNRVYVAETGNPVSGRTTYVHSGAGPGIAAADATAKTPYQFTVAANIPWLGTGTSHVFNANGTALTKVAGVAVPGQTSLVYSESLSNYSVTAGAFVPGSGAHQQGGAVRVKVYTGTNPTNQLQWIAGADTPWDVDAATRFNISGAEATYSAGDAYPAGTNTVFDTDWSSFTKSAGAEVPGSSGYDRTHAETGDADGLGPAAQVYNALLSGVAKTRGGFVPGTGSSKVYSSTGAGATITTPSAGDSVILSSGVSPSTIYFQPGGAGTTLVGTTKTNQLQDPTNPIRVFEIIDPSATTPEAHSLARLTSSAVSGSTLTLRQIPGGAPGGQEQLWYYFDPGVNTGGAAIDPGAPGASMTAAGQPPSLFMLLDAPPLAFANDPSYKSPALFSPVVGGAPIPAAEAIAAGLMDPSFETMLSEPVRFESLVVGSGATDTQGQFVTTTLSGTGLAGMGASTSTTTSTRTSGAYRSMMADPRATSRWL